MATQRFDDRGLVVRAPDAVTVRQVVHLDSPAPGASRSWHAPRAGQDDPLLGALGEAGFARIDAFDLRAPGDGATRAGLGAPEIEVTLGRDEEAVVLVQTEDGACHWMLPEEDRTKRGGLDRIRRFEFRFGRADDPPAARRSLFSRIANLRSWVLRFIVTGVAARIDGDGPFGLVPMLGAAPGTWRAGEVARLPAPGGAAPRILLAVHGTFSSTRTFAPLAWGEAGESFLARAGRRYDAVLGFDHKTLGDAADQNAKDLMQALSAIAPPEGLAVDAFAHSRGGLILRAAIETAHDAAAGRIRFDRVAFVGCPLAGTHLADKENWRALTDLYTTLALAAAKATAPLAPGVSAGAAALGATIGVVGRFVQALAKSAVDEGNVPGLRSMLPGGSLVTGLAAAAAHSTGARYATISSDFDPSLAPLLQRPLETLKGLLLDRLADDLFGNANDLVVDTASMAVLAPYVLAEAGDLALGRNGLAYHTAYFLQPKVLDSLATWFGLPEARASDRLAIPVETPEPAPTVRGRFGGGVLGGFIDPFSVRPTFRFDRVIALPQVDPGAGAAATGGGGPGAGPSRPLPGDEPDATRPYPAGDDPAPKDGAPAADVPCHFAAEMPPSLQVGAAVDLSVTLARAAIVPADGAITALGTAPVAPDAMLDIRILAVSGCTVAEGGEAAYPVPAAGVPTIHKARIRGAAAGRAKVAIDILQKKRVLCSLLLEPLVYADPDAPIVASATALVPAVAIGGSLVLRIYEDVRDGKVTLTFVADCDDPSINAEAKTEAMPGSIEDMTAQIYRGIERYTPETLDFEPFEEAMAVLGRTLWRQLVPKDIADAIKDNRDALKAIQVVSGSCRLPWELVRIPGPDSEGLSFAELGLVRWLPNCPWPGPRLSLAAGTIIRPDYDGTDGLRPLPHAVAETQAIQEILPRLGILAPATRNSFRTLLANGGFDVLHFAGHGAAQAEVVLEQPTLVLGQVKGRHHLFQSDEVADAFSASGHHPIVFLNACQAGRASRSFFGVDGFARAFLKPDSRKGAAAFISPLWSVGDLQAKLFARTFYDRLEHGEILVDAVKAARKAAREGQEATWLSYTVYGDPFACVATKA